MLEMFLVRAGLAGLGVAFAAAPLGCFVVWRRMAYFGDAVSHAALLGVALALIGHLPIFAGTLAVALASAILLLQLDERNLASDAALGVLAHSALAFSLVIVSLVGGIRMDLSAYLFGDILSVNATDLWVIWLGAAAVVGTLTWRWSRLLLVTLNPDLAKADGITPGTERIVFTLALALTIAVALKVVGALLITALLLIPPTAARPLARTPEQMAFGAALIGALSVAGGLVAAFHLDTPAGPSIICTGTFWFCAIRLVAPHLKR